MFIMFASLRFMITLFTWIVIFLVIIGVSFTVIGALLGKRDIGEWIVLIGLIQIFLSILLGAFTWNYLHFWPYLSNLAIAFGFIGIILVIIGGLTPEKKEKVT